MRPASRRLDPTAVVALLAGLLTLPAFAAPTATGAAVQRLRNGSTGRIALSYHPATGAVRFARPVGTGAHLAQPKLSGGTPQARAIAFLDAYGKAFGVDDAARDLDLARENREPDGTLHLGYAQVHRGVPVFGAMLRVHLAPGGEVLVVNGALVPDLDVDTVPRVSAAEARAIAARATGADGGGRRTPAPRLLVFREGFVRGVPGPNRLAWEVVSGGAKNHERVYVDAHGGKLLDRVDASPEVMRREVYLRGTTAADRVWQEGQPLPYTGGTAGDNPGINKVIDYSGDAYEFFDAMGAFQSWDGRSSTMSSVWDATEIGEEDCPNANWDSSDERVYLCRGVESDDVVAHEWTHAYSQGTHDLIYQWQPGALNEAYSDIFGETVDQINRADTDEPSGRRTDGRCARESGGSDDSVRWIIAEGANSFGGALRDMWQPGCLSDPDSVLDQDYFCRSSDSGGVHTNSGIPNHAYALLVDGGTFNGQTVTGIGLTRAAHIYWRAMSVYQTPVTEFADHADSLEQSCNDLAAAGTNLRSLVNGSPSGEVVTTANCDSLRRAIAAVELRAKPDCDFEPLLIAEAPRLCGGTGRSVPFFFEDFQGGAAGWTRSNSGVYAEYSPRDWQLDSTLPGGRQGTAAYAIDSVRIGDCRVGSDDQSGAMRFDSPAVTVPAGSPRLAFEHYVATEKDWDGGNVKYSRNGAAFTLVPKDRFVFNPYNQALVDQNSVGVNTNPMKGQDAFTGTNEGSVSGSWGQSQVDLTGLVSPGDNVRLRFEFGVDGCNGADGWYVDDVQLFTCSSAPPEPCVADGDTLCLLSNRFRVEVDWHNPFNNANGRGKVVPPPSDFAGVWFFDDVRNVELMVKILELDGVIKVFYGQLTNFDFTMTVTDTRTGIAKRYSNTPGQCGAIDQSAFPKRAGTKAGSCVSAPDALCLLDDRFRIKVAWRNQFSNVSGTGSTHRLSDLAGTWSFDDLRNTELMTKMLNFGDRILFFAGAVSDLEYSMTVTDTTTGETKRYDNPAGRYCSTIDNNAF